MSPRGSAEDEWESLLSNNPKVLWGLVADVVKAIKAREGEKKTGRRPGVSVSSLDELYELMFPTQFTMDPFPEALRAALGRRTQREFAVETGINQGSLSKLLSGKLAPTLATMEMLAYALRVPPTYFIEYRAGRIAQIVAETLTRDPEFSAALMRRAIEVPA